MFYYEDLKNIEARLKAWREERRLSANEQVRGLIGNLYEEMSEYARAKNDFERIDAICDIMVFAINAKKSCVRLKDFDFEPKRHEILIFLADDISSLIVNFDDNDRKQTRREGALNGLISTCAQCLEVLGVDVNLAVLEAIREIESRIGAWNEDKQKFVKYKGAYSKDEVLQKFVGKNVKISEDEKKWYAELPQKNKEPLIFDYVKWYKADYSKCLKKAKNER